VKEESPAGDIDRNVRRCTLPLETSRLKLVAQSREDVHAFLEQMQPQDRTQVSAAWVALLENSAPVDPWIHGFSLVSRVDGSIVGRCGFKGPPAAGVVEIAYGIEAEQQGKGYATEAAEALVAYAVSTGEVRLVRAHTLPEPNASTRVLTKAGFQRVGQVVDPEDGLVWRWEKRIGS
jgi:[ribosomal protein S5]-alanine N-acetyltransferase